MSCLSCYFIISTLVKRFPEIYSHDQWFRRPFRNLFPRFILPYNIVVEIYLDVKLSQFVDTRVSIQEDEMYFYKA